MALINVPAAKNIEFLDLEVHAVICEQRRLALEEKINAIAVRISEFEQQQRANKKLVLGAIISIVTGVISTAASLLMRNY